MNQETLHLFSQQLAHWARQALEEGRSPFRKVELHPSLLTPSGECRPPLVFWINRESCLAGGVVLLPEGDPAAVIANGRDCATAIGLRHFVTWAAHEIVIWEIQGEATLIHQTLPLDTQHPAGFQQALRRLLEALKPLSIMGACPPDQLAPCYLANLWRTALRDSLPPLTDAYRAAHAAERPATATAPPELAYDKGLLTLLRLLALTGFELLSATLPPEELENAMGQAGDGLPEALRKPLQRGFWEIPLPPTTAVRFHHLFRRLGQIGASANRQRLIQALELFGAGEAAALGAHAVIPPELPADCPALLLHPLPTAADTPRAALMEIGRPPLLALLALSRTLRGHPAARRQAGDVFALHPLIPPTWIQGALADNTPPDRDERQVLTTHLRGSWPTRRFALDRKTPRWIWEFLHLLGLAADGASLVLEVPRDWLTATSAEPLVKLVQEEFTLLRLTLLDPTRLTLELRKTRRPEQATQFATALATRTLGWRELSEGHRALLSLALSLDSPTFALLESGRLAIPSPEDWPTDRLPEVFLFSRSSLGRRLWDIVSGGHPLPGLATLEEPSRRMGLPLPGREVLDQLRRLGWREDRPLPSPSRLDDIVGHWLGAPLVTEIAAPKPPILRPRAPAPTDALLAEIANEVFVDGVPRFPEQYLYDHYRPHLATYRFTPPLVESGEFFGRFALRDGTGQELEVEGPDSARALLLAAAAGQREIALPTEPALARTILARYLGDLRQLRQALARSCHVRIAHAGTAARSIDRIWRERGLPPWELCQE